VVAQGWQHVGKVQRVEKLKDGVELTAGAPKSASRPSAMASSGVRLAPTGAFPKDSSWAVIESPDPRP